MEDFLNYELSLKLKEICFNEPCLAYYNNENLCIENPEYLLSAEKARYIFNDFICLAPSLTLTFKWFRNSHGLYVHSRPEFYYTGINFNWQILWYLPKKEWSGHDCNDGTFFYGDNGEYPTQESANIAMIEKMIEIVKNRRGMGLGDS